MTDRLLTVLIFSLVVFNSCQSQTTAKQKIDNSQATQTATKQEPNYNYTVDVPYDWTIRDTTMPDGLRVRFLVPPQSLKTDYPSGNVLITIMEGQDINNFTTNNINYLKANMPGIEILERGNIDSSIYKGQWYTYTKDQNGIVRDMINYIIPLNGFAYMITCGAKKGSMTKYRETFDKIAKSFKG